VPGYLLDASVLIALAWPEHAAHERCSRWFGRNAQAGWATCPITQAALVRVLSNPAFSEHALSPSKALQVLSQNLELAGHHFWSDSIDLRQAMEAMRTPVTGHQQITDACLVALAIHNRGKLATLDRGVVELAPAGAVEVVR
jgi:toxin-antitoxin system PIN domain toxin